MSLAQELDQLSDAYSEQEGENRAEVVEAIKKLHVGVIKKPAELAEFKQLAPTAAGGAYLPYLAWMELAAILNGSDDRNYWIQLMQALADSDFDETLLRQVKPLLVIYYNTERAFEIDKMEAKVLTDAHPSVREFFQKMRAFITANKTGVAAYHEKFNLLKSYFPNFDLFELATPELKEYLEEARAL